MATLVAPASLVARWKSDSVSGNDGDAIQTWTDSVAGYVFEQTQASKKPLLKKAGNGLNGHNCLAFDGSDDYMSIAHTAAFNLTTYTIFVVCKSVGTGASKTLIAKADSGTAVPYPYNLLKPATGTTMDFRANDTSNTPTAQKTTFSTANVVFTGARTAGSTLALYQDGTLAQSVTDTATGTSTNSARLSLGARANADGISTAGTTSTVMTVAEILICSDNNATTRMLVHSYIQDEYGITTADHAAVPDAPTSLTLGTATTTTQPLSWTAPASDGGSAITDYVVQWSPAGAGTWTTFADGTLTGTTATVTGLTHSTSYDYRVAAVNILGTGPNSTTATGSTAAAGGAPPSRRTGSLQAELNRLAGTVNLAETGAANIWAGTTGKALLGALNAKNGTVGVGLQKVCNDLAGTQGLAPAEALSRI